MTIYNSDSGGMTAHAIDGAYHTGSLAHASTSGKTATDHHSNTNDPSSGEKTYLTDLTANATLYEYGPRRSKWVDVWQPKYGTTPADCPEKTSGSGVAPAPTAIGGELAIRMVTGVALGTSSRCFGSPSGTNPQGIYQAAKNAVIEGSFVYNETNKEDDKYYIGFDEQVVPGTESCILLSFEQVAALNAKIYLYAKNAAVANESQDSGVTPVAGTRYYFRIVCTATTAALWLGTTYAGMTLRCTCSNATTPNCIPTASMCGYAKTQNWSAVGGSAPSLDCFDVRATQDP